MLSGIIQDDVHQGQTGALAAGVGLHLDHGGVVGTAGIVLLLSKVIAACNGASRITKAGDRQVFIVVPCALSHSQVTHDIDRRTVLCHVDRLGQRGVGLILRTGIAVAAVAADIDCRARTSGGKDRGGQKPEHQHKCHQG